ncbi:MAG: hypothetical protein R2769_07375 [Saprospiraceae bacterium]
MKNVLRTAISLFLFVVAFVAISPSAIAQSFLPSEEAVAILQSKIEAEKASFSDANPDDAQTVIKLDRFNFCVQVIDQISAGTSVESSVKTVLVNHYGISPADYDNNVFADQVIADHKTAIIDLVSQ